MKYFYEKYLKDFHSYVILLSVSKVGLVLFSNGVISFCFDNDIQESKTILPSVKGYNINKLPL